eukprot:3983233-Amphidinium_carterae.2
MLRSPSSDAWLAATTADDATHLTNMGTPALKHVAILQFTPLEKASVDLQSACYRKGPGWVPINEWSREQWAMAPYATKPAKDEAKTTAPHHFLQEAYLGPVSTSSDFLPSIAMATIAESSKLPPMAPGCRLHQPALD